MRHPWCQSSLITSRLPTSLIASITTTIATMKRSAVLSTASSIVGSRGPPGSQSALTPLAVQAAAAHAAIP